MSDRHEIRYDVHPVATVVWLQDRGFRATTTIPSPGSLPAVLFAKGNGQVRMALVGDVLVHSGSTVKVESP